MDWQTAAVVLAIILALAYVARRAARAWAGKAAGCGGCACARPKERPAVVLLPPEEITLRRRR
jgi:hypothetical protein